MTGGKKLAECQTSSYEENRLQLDFPSALACSMQRTRPQSSLLQQSGCSRLKDLTLHIHGAERHANSNGPAEPRPRGCREMRRPPASCSSESARGLVLLWATELPLPRGSPRGQGTVPLGARRCLGRHAEEASAQRGVLFSGLDSRFHTVPVQ